MENTLLTLIPNTQYNFEIDKDEFLFLKEKHIQLTNI